MRWFIDFDVDDNGDAVSCGAEQRRQRIANVRSQRASIPRLQRVNSSETRVGVLL